MEKKKIKIKIKKIATCRLLPQVKISSAKTQTFPNLRLPISSGHHQLSDITVVVSLGDSISSEVERIERQPRKGRKNGRAGKGNRKR